MIVFWFLFEQFNKYPLQPNVSIPLNSIVTGGDKHTDRHTDNTRMDIATFRLN